LLHEDTINFVYLKPLEKYCPVYFQSEMVYIKDRANNGIRPINPKILVVTYLNTNSVNPRFSNKLLHKFWKESKVQSILHV